MFDPIKHRGVFQHVREHDENDFRPTNVHLVRFTFHPVDVPYDGIFDVQIHLIFRLEQQPTYQFARLGFNFNHGTLSIV
jgi:hypothetical protein